MLVKISNSEAFEMLMNEEEAERVYFRANETYYKALEFKWEFRHFRKQVSQTSTNIVTTTFYKEVED